MNVRLKRLYKNVFVNASDQTKYRNRSTDLKKGYGPTVLNKYDEKYRIILRWTSIKLSKLLINFLLSHLILLLIFSIKN